MTINEQLLVEFFLKCFVKKILEKRNFKKEYIEAILFIGQQISD